MTPHSIRCPCGELFHVDSAQQVARLRCRRCGRVISLRRRSAPAASRLLALLSGWWRIPRRLRRTAAGATRPRANRPQRRHTLLRRAVDTSCWAYLVAVVVLAVVLWTLGDLWWPATVLLFSGRWIFATPLFLLAPAALLLSRRALVPVAVAAVVMAGPVMGVRLGLGKLARSDALPLRVVTFNVDGGAQVVPQLDALLADWRPDLFAAQECGDELAAALRARTGWTFDQVGGLCLLSRYPVVSRSVMDRRVLSAIRNGGAQIGGSGAVVRYAIRTPMGLVHFTNVHLETPRWGLQDLVQGRHLDPTRLELNTQLRDVESDLARRYVDAGGGHAIVAGDFNTPSESRIFRRHWGDLTDAFTAAGIGLGMTKYNGWIRVRIDHVLADPSLRIVGARVGQDAGSDHLPLIVDIEQ